MTSLPPGDGPAGPEPVTEPASLTEPGPLTEPAPQPAPDVAPPREAPPLPPATALGELVLLGVLLAVCIGLVLVGQDHWKRGLYLIALAVLGAAGLRLLLPTRSVGLLAVRGRVVDTAVLAVLGAAVLVLTLAVPVPHR